MLQPGGLPCHQAFRRHRLAPGVDLTERAVVAHALVGEVLGQHVPVGGSQVHRGDASLDDLPVQRLAVPDLGAAQHHRGATGERRVELLDEAVEIEGGELQHPVVRPDAEELQRNVGMPRQALSADADALGTAGGTGGEHHVGEVLRMRPQLRVARRTVLPVPRLVERQAGDPGGRWQALQQVALAEQQGDAAVLDHVAEALLRIFRVQRYVSAAGLEHRQQTDDHFQPALDGDPNQHVRPHAQLDQAVGQAVGLGVELAVAQLALLEEQCDPLGLHRRAAGEQLLDAALVRIASRVAPPVEDRLAPLRRFQQLELGQAGAGRTLDHLRQQVRQVTIQARHAGVVEMLAVIGELQFQALPQAYAEGQRVVGLLVVAHGTESQALRGLLLEHLRNGVVLEHQDIVEQRLAALPGPALDVVQRRVFEFAQGQVLALHRLQPGRQALLRKRASDDRQGIDEQADLLLDTVQFRRATGDSSAEGHAVLSGIALQQHQPGGLDQGIDGDLLLAGQLGQAPGLLAIELAQPFRVALAALPGLGDRLPQAGRLVQLAQARQPEGLGERGVLALQPGDVVAIAAAGARRRFATVALQYLAEQLRVAPAVHQDMVIGVDQVVALFVRAHQYQAQQRRLAQVEAQPAFAGSQLVEGRRQVLATAPVKYAERHFDTLAHHL